MDEPQPASNTWWRPRFRRFRFQVSLLTALLLMTIVGMAVVIVQLWREVHPLRQEVFAIWEDVMLTPWP